MKIQKATAIVVITVKNEKLCQTNGIPETQECIFSDKVISDFDVFF